MKHNKKISLVMATLMAVQTVTYPIIALANEVESAQEETVVERPEIEEVRTEVITEDNQEETKEQGNKEKEFFSTEETKNSEESVNEESVVIEKETESQDSVVPQATTHLLSKAKFHQYLIDSQDLTALRFVASEVPAGVNAANQTDLSENGDRSVIGYKDGTTGIITSGVAGERVELPVDSRSLLENTRNPYEDLLSAVIEKLTSINFEAIDTSNVTNMSRMFAGCWKLTKLDISGFDTSNVTNMAGMFSWCGNLTMLDVSNFNTSKVTNMSGMFSACSELATLDVSNFNTSNVTDMSWMFWHCRNLTTLDVGNFDTSNVTNMRNMFDSCGSLKTLDISNFDTSKVTDMSGMFSAMGLIALDVSNFNTSKVTNMSHMFSSCPGLTTLDVSNFDTSKVTDMSSMFRGPQDPTRGLGLTAVDVSNFNTSNVTNMSQMFELCRDLTILDLSNFDTSKVTNMYNMFSSSTGLMSLDVSNWNTSNVTSMSDMFFGCSSLTTLDLSGWDTSRVTSMRYMFARCSSLVTIYANDWNIDEYSRIGYQMFSDCIHLIGVDQNNQMTPFNASKVEGNMATPNGGYFTDPSKKEVQWTVTINYVSNEKVVVGNANFQVTNLNPVVTAAQIAGAIPAGYEAAGTITDVTATQDGQIFDIQVQPMTAPVEETWSITIDFKDEAGNSVGIVNLTVPENNPVISVEELNSKLPAGYKLLLEQPVTVLAESIVNGAGTIIVPVLPVSGSQGGQTSGVNKPIGGTGNEGVKDPNKNGGVNTSTETMAGLYATLGIGALVAIPSIIVKKRKKK